MKDIVTSIPAAAVVSTWTMGSGIATILDLIPDNIGKLASVVGIILSVVLIFMHVILGRKRSKKLELEIKIMQAELKKCETDNR